MNIKNFLWECFDTLKYAVIIFLILFFTLWPLRIEGSSMNPTFNSGDRIIMSRIMISLGIFDRGDIVISRVYNENHEGQDIIKRIIAMPGDNLVIQNGNVYIDGEKLYEPYSLSMFTEGNMNIFLEDGQYFIMGDNRAISNDSRDLGFVYREQISGRVILRWYPFSQINFY